MISILIAGAVAMFMSLAGTRFLMSYFRRLGKGQPILGAEDHGPVHQMGKQGTPTMGGIAILVSGLVGWTVAHFRDGLPFSDQAAIIWLAVFVLGFIGFLDDYLKVRRQHNRGIFWKKKGWITFGITIGLTLILAASTGVVETISFTRAMSPGWDISGPLFVVWTALMVWSTTNAVNVTDGLDGLAAGSALFGFLAFTVIAYWAFRNPRIYDEENQPGWEWFDDSVVDATTGRINTLPFFTDTMTRAGLTDVVQAVVGDSAALGHAWRERL